MDLRKLAKKMEESRFCYAKDGGQGFVHQSECTCTKENPCQAIIDKERFHKALEGLEYDDVKGRNEIVQQIKSEFKGSQWWKDNVVE